MTGYEIYERALALLGVEQPIDENVPLLSSSALVIVNAIGSDLKEGFCLENIFMKADVDDSLLPAFTYGVAMMMAALLERTEQNAFFCDLYNAKRASVKNGTAKIKNVIPTA